MKIVRFQYKGREYSGSLQGDKIIPDTDEIRGSISLEDISILAPVSPSKIVCVGLNYKDHSAELGMKQPEEPVIFLKPSSSIIPSGVEILCPGSSSRIDYEAELGIVIKDKISCVAKDEAKSHVLGYTCVNDVTARDLQEKDGQWTRAKSFDTFCPIGPCIATGIDPDDLSVRSYLNGELKQSSRTSDFIFSIEEMISFISGIMTLYPGDVISTGTPTGVGPMRPGDEIVVEIEEIGRLVNAVSSGKSENGQWIIENLTF